MTLKPAPGTARILVATDNAADADQVAGQLKPDFEQVRVSIDPLRAVDDFEDFQPDVLVLAFDSLDKARHYHLGLYRLGRTLQRHPHRTIVLCSHAELRAAFELCKQDHFDDYVLYWPQAHDAHRLAMSIWVACREMKARAHGADAPRPAQWRAHARHLGELESTLDREMEEGDRRIAAARAALGEFAAHKVEPVSAWAREFRSRVAPPLAATHVLADKLAHTRPLVLVVDDDELARKLIGRALDPAHYETVFAADGVAALSQLRQLRPDAILMDIRLPGVDGLALTRRLKASPHLADIPVIMLTGDARRETLVSSMEAGAAGFVVKPFTRESLIAKVEKVLAR